VILLLSSSLPQLSLYKLCKKKGTQTRITEFIEKNGFLSRIKKTP
jgi:hypothetical protein